MMLQAGVTTNWHYAWAKAIGTAHLQKGLGCDDACLIQPLIVNGEEWLLVSVSDGAGSARLGAEGARHVTERFVSWMTDRCNTTPSDDLENLGTCELWFNEWIPLIQQELDQLASEKGISRRDYACTWIGAIINQQGMLIGQVGDGALVYRQTTKWTVAIWPMQGEYANTTMFITDERALEWMQTRIILTPFEAICAFTDGIQRMALQWQSKEAFSGFLEPMYQSFRSIAKEDSEKWAAQVKSWLESPTVCARTDDDKTLMMVVST